MISSVKMIKSSSIEEFEKEINKAIALEEGRVVEKIEYQLLHVDADNRLYTAMICYNSRYSK